MKTRINTSEAPAAIGPYSQAVKSGDMVFASGQLPVDPATGKLVDGLEAQVEQVMKNVKAVLAEAGCTYDNVVKTTVFLQNMADFAAMNAIYANYFDSEVKPARSTVEVAKLPMGALVEMEFIAVM
ncbi:MAG: RidA family protein [Planctomycetes bacterium]|nr:RidA family protein [Planctomycetota bacterium]